MKCNTSQRTTVSMSGICSCPFDVSASAPYSVYFWGERGRTNREQELPGFSVIALKLYTRMPVSAECSSSLFPIRDSVDIRFLGVLLLMGDVSRALSWGKFSEADDGLHHSAHAGSGSEWWPEPESDHKSPSITAITCSVVDKSTFDSVPSVTSSNLYPVSPRYKRKSNSLKSLHTPFFGHFSENMDVNTQNVS